MLLLAASIYIVDKWRLGRPNSDSDRAESSAHPLIYRPLLVFGTNAILAYLISELGDSLLTRVIHFSSGLNAKVTAYRAINSAISQPGYASLIYSLVFVLISWLLVLPFYRKRIFLRI